MDKIISANMKKALSDADIRNTKKCPIYMYKELRSRKLSELGEYFIVLIPTKSDYNGHWISCIRRKNIVEYYDPYGYTIDHLVKGKKYLSRLLCKAGVTVICNKTKLQGNSNCCGRYALIRILMRHKNLADFMDLFYNQPLSPDEIVTYLTMYI